LLSADQDFERHKEVCAHPAVLSRHPKQVQLQQEELQAVDEADGLQLLPQGFEIAAGRERLQGRHHGASLLRHLRVPAVGVAQDQLSGNRDSSHLPDQDLSQAVQRCKLLQEVKTGKQKSVLVFFLLLRKSIDKN